MSAIVPARRPSPARVARFAALLLAVAWGLGAFAAWPWAATAPDAAVLRLSIRHVSGFTGPVRTRSEQELARLPAHMRPRESARPATGRRGDATLTVVVDGRTVLQATYRPTGLRRDGPIHAYEEVAIAPGRHAVEVTLTDATSAADAGARRMVRELVVGPRQAPLLEYSDAGGWKEG